MKKSFLTVISAAAVIIAALTINSCTKQESSEPAIMQKEAGSQVTAEEKAILNSIINFRDEIAYITEHPGYKSGEEVEVDSAIWYLDATLNLTHAFISWTPMSNFYQDSVFVIIPKTGDDISMDDLAAAYTELKQKVANVCIAAPGTDKELYIASLTKKTETTGDITVRAYATVGSTTPPGDEEPFDMAWMYGDKKGISPDPDPYDGSDACLELRDTTNEYRYLYIDDSEMLYISVAGEDPYVTIKSQNPIFINPDHPAQHDNMYERYLLYEQSDWTGYHKLISVDEMNWYYHKLHYVIYNMVPDNQEEWPNAYNKTFIKIIDSDDPQYGTYGTEKTIQSVDKILHQFKIEYRRGIHIENKGEPESITGN